jgi:hypothetical protein
MVGALAAIPAMAVAAAFGIATLLGGFKGLGAAMNGDRIEPRLPSRHDGVGSLRQERHRASQAVDGG